MFHFGGGACVDTDTGSSPKNVRDRHRLLPQKLAVLLYMDDIIVSKLEENWTCVVCFGLIVLKFRKS
jgi:hypothetical protein